jgi:hypothetical protein
MCTFPSLSEPIAVCVSAAVPPSTIRIASVITTVFAVAVRVAKNNVERTESNIIDTRLTDFIF